MLLASMNGPSPPSMKQEPSRNDDDPASLANPEALFPELYDELRRLAVRYMSSERASHTLQPTALVHEVWLRLAGDRMPQLDRGRFYCAAATAMRRILINHARDKRRLKRGGGGRRVELDASHLEDSPREPVDLLALDEALEKLAKQDALKACLVELRYFAGLDNQAVAEVLGVSLSMVKREWTTARAWLRLLMESEGERSKASD